MNVNDFWRGRRVLVTGGGGFVGSHAVEMLVERGAQVTATVSPTPNPVRPANLQHVTDAISLRAVDLAEAASCLQVCEGQEVVFHIASADGSTAFKRARPAFIFRQNMLLTMNMLEAARVSGVERFLLISSAEVYSPDAPVPTPEAEGLVGLPDALTSGYAWSKRASELAAGFFAAEYGLQVNIARPSNVYGPRDHLDPARGRVIPMLIKRVFDAQGPLVLWGTGEQTRTFLYAQDLARGLLDLVEKYPHSDPVNLGGAEEITIKALAEQIVRLCERPVSIVCDADKPGGPLRRAIDGTRAKQVIGFEPTVPLEVGLQHTINYFRQHLSS